MPRPCPALRQGSPLVVASAASTADLSSVQPDTLRATCDLVEVRLDLLGDQPGTPWAHLDTLPLLFTARRPEEGGVGELKADERRQLLEAILDQASLIDIEVASLAEMAPLIEQFQQRHLPWIASFHNFETLPSRAVLEDACHRAREAGAHVFKVAAQLEDAAALDALLEFQRADHGLPIATMGMGEFGVESRLRCAEAGSVLNYGYLGETPTAPGQMSAARLKQAIDG